MSLKALAHVFATGMLAVSAYAQCQASNSGGSGPINNDKLCLSQGPGSFTFGMEVTAVAVPDPSGNNAGFESATSLFIFDESCNILGTYDVPDCGVPFIIEENFLTQVLTMQSINTDVGAPFFSFTYGDGQFSIRNNQCVCNDESSGLTAKQGCRCAFPVDGTFEGKREIKAIPFSA